jgi:hypothetical protein
MEEIFYFIFLKEKTYFLVSPERLWGDLLGVMDAARRNVSVLLINHPSGPYLCTHTHTHSRKEEEKKKGR